MKLDQCLAYRGYRIKKRCEINDPLHLSTIGSFLMTKNQVQIPPHIDHILLLGRLPYLADKPQDSIIKVWNCIKKWY